MDACHHYGQKQEGACQLHDPHKTEQEILAGNERERDGSFFFFFLPSPALLFKGRSFVVILYERQRRRPTPRSARRECAERTLND